MTRTETSQFSHLKDDELLGLNIDREARGEPTAGRIAVGSVVLNRVKFGLDHKAWGRLYGNSIKSVILASPAPGNKDAQFSWIIPNQMDPNYTGAIEIAKDFGAALEDSEAGDKCLVDCYDIAQKMLAGEIKTNTSALLYHEIHVHPAWARGRKPMAAIGHHLFYA
jgi:hypothetical protein